jgi:hypothetical protein
MLRLEKRLNQPRGEKMILKKVCASLAVALFCFGSFLVGFEVKQNANAVRSNSMLPVAKGGTGANTFASGGALIGNGTNPFTSRGIDESPASGSNNLITSGALNSVNKKAQSSAANNNFYKSLDTTTDSGGNEIYVLGEVPTLSAASGQYTNLYGDYVAFRYGGWARFIKANMIINIGYADSTPNSNNIKFINLQKSNSANAAELGTFTYNGVKYVGLHISGSMTMWTTNLKGYYSGSLPMNCSGSVTVCLGTKIQYSGVTGWITYAAS